MANWAEIQAEVPEFAAQVRERFDAGTNKTIATLRRDGSPRISGTELVFGDDDVTLGMMPHSVKLADVLHDPRVAVHSPTLEPPAHDPTAWLGDAKLAGLLRAVDTPESSPDPAAPFFALDITEVVLTYVSGEELVVESWHPGRGWSKFTRT
ncbi:MAG: pyridoxamine 5-phosphate oxidase-related FMN-binding protein [Glaciihabitans sp.]|nr:pyridoxamine 5-phosphate oxidase-related FMN-binding protein [Glaciihabitans sp.]